MGPVFSGDNLAFPGALGRGYRGGRAVERLVDVTSERLNQDSHRAAQSPGPGVGAETSGTQPSANDSGATPSATFRFQSGLASSPLSSVSAPFLLAVFGW